MKEREVRNVEKAAKEKANLFDLYNNVKSAAEEVKKSLSGYFDKNYLSPLNVPENVDSLQQVLSRFFEDKKINDIYDLVDNNESLLVDAIEFTKNPIAGKGRAVYSEANMALRIIKTNLDEYKKFDSKLMVNEGKATKDGGFGFMSAKKESSENDGFRNYVEKAQIITNFVKAYNKLMSYTEGLELDLNDLPKTVEEFRKNVNLAIAAPGVQADAEEFSKGAPQPEGNNNRYEVGGEEYIKLLNKAVRDHAVYDITKMKHLCYKGPILYALEYNKCVYGQGAESKNIDIYCKPKQDAYEKSKANCDSHFPMVVAQDLIMEDIMSLAEKMHFIPGVDGVHRLDLDDSSLAVQRYNAVGNAIHDIELPAVAGVAHAGDDSSEKAAEDELISFIINASRILGKEPEQLLLAGED